MKINQLKKYLRLHDILQFVKFGLVGVSNTLISYGIEMLCYYVIFNHVAWNENIKIVVISTLAFIVSVTNSYFWNSRYVFSEEKSKKISWHIVRYFKTVVCYGLTGLILAPALKMVAIQVGVPYWLGSLGTLIVTIPLNFVLNKFWAFQTKI